jgi:ubiquinone biosynthesis protein
VRKDVAKTLDAILHITLWDEEIDIRSAKKDVNEFIELYFHRHFKDINVRKLLNRLLSLLTKHKLRMPPELFLMLKCMATMESLCRRINPDVDILKKAAPYFVKNKLSRYNPVRVAGGVVNTTIDYADLVKALPRELRDISTKLRHGRLKINLEHVGIPRGLFQKIEKLGNRLIIGLVVVSLIVSSALIFIAKTPPFIYGIPAFGICGFIFACIIGIWLLISIFLRGRL